MTEDNNQLTILKETGLTENENKLIENLFDEARRQEIEDDGFSRRVMRSLPSADSQFTVRMRRISRLWTAFCIMLGIALLAVTRTFEQLPAAIENLIRHVPEPGISQIVHAPLLIAAIVTAALWIYRRFDAEELPI